MRGIKIPLQDFALQIRGEGVGGGAYARGGAYLQDTTVLLCTTNVLHFLHSSLLVLSSHV